MIVVSRVDWRTGIKGREDIGRVHRQLGLFCRLGRLSRPVQDHIALIVDEIVSNMVRHAQGPPYSIYLCSIWPYAMLHFSDRGALFNPQIQPPSTNRLVNLSDRVGGWGLGIVQRLSHRIHYRRRSGRNQVTIIYLIDRCSCRLNKY